MTGFLSLLCTLHDSEGGRSLRFANKSATQDGLISSLCDESAIDTTYISLSGSSSCVLSTCRSVGERERDCDKRVAGMWYIHTSWHVYNIICIHSCRVSRTSVTCLSVLKVVDICSLLPAVGAVAEAADEQKDDHQRHHSHTSSDHCRHQPWYGGHEVGGRVSCRWRLSCGCRGRERRSLNNIILRLQSVHYYCAACVCKTERNNLCNYKLLTGSEGEDLAVGAISSVVDSPGLEAVGSPRT